MDGWLVTTTGMGIIDTLKAMLSPWIQRALRKLNSALNGNGYALAGTTKPISVAEWETQLTRSLPDELKGSLPSIEEIEAELAGEVEGNG